MKSHLLVKRMLIANKTNPMTIRLREMITVDFENVFGLNPSMSAMLS